MGMYVPLLWILIRSILMLFNLQLSFRNVYLCENRVTCNLSIVKDIELNGKIQDHRQVGI